MTVDGESKVLTYSVSQWHFFYHRSHIDCPGLKTLITEIHVLYQGSPSGIYGRRSGTGTGFSAIVYVFFFCNFLFHWCCILVCIFICLRVLSVIHSLDALQTSVIHAAAGKNIQKLFVYLSHCSLIIWYIPFLTASDF
jgi:hypothetical protein